jgi:acylphosphatase
MKRARLLITGRVQGVGFRYAVRQQARSHHLAGWVSNRPDGSVEAVVEGEDERVDSVVRWCGRGPAGAHVEDVDVAWEEPRGENGFAVR